MRRRIFPLVGHLLSVVPEKVEIELERSNRRQAYDPAYFAKAGGLAIGRQTHDLVFVPLIRKAQVMRERLIEEAERVREMDPPHDLDVLARPTPHAALAKSPKPPTETTTASSNGETWNAEERCAR